MRRIGADDKDRMKLHFGEVIRVYRRREGFTQEELAKLIGVSSVTVGNYEKGRSMPDVEKALIICQILRIPKGIIFGEPTENDALILYRPDGDLIIDEYGGVLCKTAQIISPVFRIYNCRKFQFSCVETGGKIYLLYDSNETNDNSCHLVRFEGSEGFVIAEFDGETYTDVTSGKKTAKKPVALAASVLGEITEYEIIE